MTLEEMHQKALRKLLNAIREVIYELDDIENAQKFTQEVTTPVQREVVKRVTTKKHRPRITVEEREEIARAIRNYVRAHPGTTTLAIVSYVQAANLLPKSFQHPRHMVLGIMERMGEFDSKQPSHGRGVEKVHTLKADVQKQKASTPPKIFRSPKTGFTKQFRDLALQLLVAGPMSNREIRKKAESLLQFPSSDNAANLSNRILRHMHKEKLLTRKDTPDGAIIYDRADKGGQ